MSIPHAGRRPPLAFATALCVAFVLACNGGNGTEVEDPSISISLSPTSGSVQQGGSVDVSVSVTGSGGFSGTASISLDSPPTGISGSVSGSQTSGGNTTATLTISAAGSVAPGSYTLAVQATGSGVSATSASFTLEVTAAPSYELTATPTQLTVEQGSSAMVDVGLARTNFTGDVTLAVEDAPAGVTASFDANPVSGDAAVLTLAVEATAAAGTYALTLRGSATGLEDRTVTLDLTVVEPGAASYSLTLTPSSTTITQGGSGTIDVGIARTNLSDPVDLSLEDAPAGVTGSFSPDPTTGDASVLTLDVGSSVAAGDYTLTVRGTTAGLADETATLTLTVEAAPGFSLASIEPLSVEQGQAGTRTVTIVRSGGFTGDVTVTVTDLPAGITASVDPPTTSGTSVDVTISVEATVTPGSYTATVRGNATGQPEATQTMDISVLAATGEEVSLDFSICVPDQRPVWLAYQDGSGPWTTVSGVGDTYTFTVTSSSVGVAIAVEETTTSSGVFVLYATPTELTTGNLAELCDVVFVGKTVTGTVAGIDPTLGESATLSLADASTQVTQDGAFGIEGVPDGIVNFVGYKQSQAGSSDRMILDRGLEPADGEDIGTYDFGTQGFDAVSATISVQGGSADTGSWQTEYASSPSAGICHYAPMNGFLYSGNQFTTGGAPAAEQQAGEYHVVTLVDGLNSVSETFSDWQNRSIAFGEAIPTPTITDITGAGDYRRLRAEVLLPAEYDALASLSLVDDTGNRAFAVFATAAWLGGLDVTLEVPELGDVAGWDDTWVPPATSSTDWIFTASGSTGTECTDGAREVSRSHLGSVN